MSLQTLTTARSSVAAASRLRPAAAMPPPNDLCSGAEVIPGAGPFPYLAPIVNVTNATEAGDPPVPCTSAALSRSVWYSFTPSVTDCYVFQTCNPPTFTSVTNGADVGDTALAIYENSGGCGGAFTPVGCTDDGCNVRTGFNVGSSLVKCLAAGTTYFVVVWKKGAAAPPDPRNGVQLFVSTFIPPNDTCAGAIAMALGTPLVGVTHAATNDYQASLDAPCPFFTMQSTGGDVVYSFTAPADGAYSFRFELPSTADGERQRTSMTLYLSTSCPVAVPFNPTVISCATSGSTSGANGSSVQHVSRYPMSAGQTVYLFVDTANGGIAFRGEVFLAASEREPNDTTSTANAQGRICNVEGACSSTDADFYTLGAAGPGSRLFAMIDGLVQQNAHELRATTDTTTVEYDRFDNDFLFGESEPNIAGARIPGDEIFLRVSSPIPGSRFYQLHAVVQPDSSLATAESEPNGSVDTASWGANDYFAGAIDSAGDVDFYGFTASAGDVVFVSLDADPTLVAGNAASSSPFDARVDLVNDVGALLVGANDGNAASSTATSDPPTLVATSPNKPGEALVFRARETGTFFVRVASGSTSAGDYLLSIARNGRSGSQSPYTTASDTAGVYVPSTGSWFLRNTNGPGSADLVFGYGPTGAGWQALRGDWDGNGIETPGLYDPATGFFYLKNASGPGAADVTFGFGPGGVGWVPIAGDWNGDGVDTVGLYNPANGFFFLRNQNAPGAADTLFGFGPGGSGLQPLAGDWNGDGMDTVGFYVPSTGFYFLRNANTPGPADAAFGFGPAGAGRQALAGDWNGDGIDTVGLYDPANGTYFLRNVLTPGPADLVFGYGPTGAVPLTGDWNGL